MNVNVFQMVADEQAEAKLSAADKLNLMRKDTFNVIARYMNDNVMPDDDFYGFVLPAFSQETGLNRQDVKDFIHQTNDIDVANFYPFAELSATHLNLFEEASIHNDALNTAMQGYLQTLNLPLTIDTWLTTFETTATTYYIVAKPAFWKVWVLLSNRLDALSHEQNPLGDALRQPSHESHLTVKDLVSERLVSLVLSLAANLRVSYLSPFSMPASQSLDQAAQTVYTQLDQLKADYMTEGKPALLAAFLKQRLLPVQASIS